MSCELKDILSRVDHTLLAQGARWEEIRTICDDGIRYGCASVCIPASYVKKAAEYVKNDYWFRPGGFAEPLLNATVPHAAALLMPPILRSAPAIPVYHDQRIMLTLRQSLKALQEDEYLLIFPEKQNGWHSYEQKISTGWMRLGELWYRASGRALKIYPVHIDTEKHVFRVSAPVWYDPARRFEEQEKELEDKLTRGIRGR